VALLEAAGICVRSPDPARGAGPGDQSEINGRTEAPPGRLRTRAGNPTVMPRPPAAAEHRDELDVPGLSTRIDRPRTSTSSRRGEDQELSRGAVIRSRWCRGPVPCGCPWC